MRFRRSRCVFIALSLTAIAAHAETGVATSREVRVMTFNIRYGTARDGENHWNNRKDLLALTIKAFDPDLLGTQETLAFQRDYLKAQLPGMSMWGVGREDGVEAGEMCALFFRTNRFEKTDGGHFWLSESPDKPGSKSWDTAITRMVSWVKLRDRRAPDDLPVLFLNTHFDHRGGVARLESARLLRRKITELGRNCRIVLTGDFNAAEQSAPYKALFGEKDGNESPVFDAFRLANPQHGNEEGTFGGFRPDATSGQRIDWIGVSIDWTVFKVVIDHTSRNGRTPSDHFPVRAIIEPQ